MQGLTMNGIDEGRLILLGFLPEALDLVIPFRLGIRLANEGKRGIALQPLGQLLENVEVLADKLFSQALQRPP